MRTTQRQMIILIIIDDGDDDGDALCICMSLTLHLIFFLFLFIFSLQTGILCASFILTKNDCWMTVRTSQDRCDDVHSVNYVFSLSCLVFSSRVYLIAATKTHYHIYGFICFWFAKSIFFFSIRFCFVRTDDWTVVCLQTFF